MLPSAAFRKSRTPVRPLIGRRRPAVGCCWRGYTRRRVCDRSIVASLCSCAGWGFPSAPELGRRLPHPQGRYLGRALRFSRCKHEDLYESRKASAKDLKNSFVFQVFTSHSWRRRWDSNPRDGFPSTPLAGVRLRPLGHVSTCVCSGATRQTQAAKHTGVGIYRRSTGRRAFEASLRGAEAASAHADAGARQVIAVALRRLLLLTAGDRMAVMRAFLNSQVSHDGRGLSQRALRRKPEGPEAERTEARA